jgi:hypothetical protein
MNLKIKHVAIIDQGAFGVILADGIPFAVTLERSYLQGEQQVTKIPNGKYHCRKRYYHAGGYATFEIIVSGHQFIMFHKANVESQLDGCVAIGEEFGILNGQPAILHCGNGGGFDEFISKTADLKEFDVEFE